MDMEIGDSTRSGEAEVVEEVDVIAVSTEDASNSVDGTATKSIIDESSLVSRLDKLLKSDDRIGWPSFPESLPEHLHGWFRPGNAETLSHIIRPQHRCILELGSWLGVSTMKLLQQAPNALVFAVDIWSNDYFLTDSHYDKSDPTFKNILEKHPIYHQFLANTKKHRLRKVTDAEGESYEGLVPMKMPSAEALRILKSLGVQPDVIYIDASHHYDYVVEDVTDCLTLFPHAQLVGDDWDNLDVRRAVNDVAARFRKEIYVNGGTCWTFEVSSMEVLQKRKRKAAEEEEDRFKRQKVLNKSSFSDILKMYKQS